MHGIEFNWKHFLIWSIPRISMTRQSCTRSENDRVERDLRRVRVVT